MSKQAKELVLAINTDIANAGLDSKYGLPVKGEVPTIPGRIERVIDKALTAAYADGFSFSASSDEVVELMDRLTATQQELAGVQRALDHAVQQRDAERKAVARLQSALADATSGQCSGCAASIPAISPEAAIEIADAKLVDSMLRNAEHRVGYDALREEVLNRLRDRADTIAALQPALLAATGELAGWKLIGETITTDNLPEVAHDVAVAFAGTLLKGSAL